MKKIFISHGEYDSNLSFFLKEELMSEGFEVFQANEINIGSDINNEVFSAIRRSDIVIAIIKEASSNVMFELGYALGASKKVILVGDKSTRVPFDISALPVIHVDPYDRSALHDLIFKLRKEPSLVQVETVLSQDPRDALIRLAEEPSLIDQIQPRDFEEIICSFFQVIGFMPEMLPPRNDVGYDILLNDVGGIGNVVVEVKKHNRNSRTSVSEVQRIIGASVIEQAAAAILITSGGFTNSAVYFAENAPVPLLLFTIEELINESKESITNQFKRREEAQRR